MDPVTIALLAALRLFIGPDGHDHTCRKRANQDKPCSIRCLQARKAIKDAQEELSAVHHCDWTEGATYQRRKAALVARILGR